MITKPCLFIRPDSVLSGRVWWSVAGEAPTALESMAALSTLADHPLAGQVCLLLPASDIICRHFTLPKTRASRRDRLLNWLAEESLLQPEALHWQVVQRSGNEVTALALSQARLARWLDACQQAGLQVVHAVPDALLLPWREGSLTLAALGDQWLVRYGVASCATLSPALLPLFIKRLEGDIRWLGTPPPTLMPGVSAGPEDGWQQMLAGLASCRVDFLQQTARQRWSENMRKYNRIITVSILYSSIIFLLATCFMLSNIHRDNRELANRIEQLYQRYYPDSPVKANHKYHLTRKIKSGSASWSRILAEISTQKIKYPDVVIGQLEIKSEPFQVAIKINSGYQVELFSRAIQQRLSLIAEQQKDADGKVVITLHHGE